MREHDHGIHSGDELGPVESKRGPSQGDQCGLGLFDGAGFEVVVEPESQHADEVSVLGVEVRQS